MRGFETGVGSKADIGVGVGRAPHVREHGKDARYDRRSRRVILAILRAPARAPSL